jgi:signal transduction histidine kinase/ligand-binding sensor domain-containing protein
MIFHTSLVAQDLVRCNFRHISPASGLSSIYVRKIIQDPFGYIWAATEDGLNRFDGRNFVVYNKGMDSKHAIAGTDIRDLLLDTVNHLIWDVNSYGGIDAIDYVTGVPVYHYYQSSDKSIAGVLFISMTLVDQSLYIAATDGVFVLNTKIRQLQRVALPNPFSTRNPGLTVDNVSADGSGNIWIFCRDAGVLVLKQGRPAQPAFLDEQALSDRHETRIRFYDNTLLQDGSVLAATSFGLRRFILDKEGKITVNNNPYPAIPCSQGTDVYACRQDKKGYIWFSGSNYLIKTAGPDWKQVTIREHYSRDEFQWLNAVYAIYFDRDDNVWLGCQQGLAYAQNQPSAFISIYRSAVSETSIRHAYFLHPLNDSVLYCCAQDGLFEVHPATGVILPLNTRSPFYHAFRDPQDRLMASSTGGTFIRSNKGWVPLGKIYPEFRHLPKLVFNSHILIGDSLIVFGTENDQGIILWNYRKSDASLVDRHSPGIWLKENNVNTLYRDNKGTIWVLGDSSVSILDLPHHTARTLNTYNPSLRKSYNIFFDLCQVKGLYYLASYGDGVLVFDSTYHFVRELSTKDGLSANSVYKILPYKDSLLFITSNNGLSVVDISKDYRVRTYYAVNGLHSDNFEENSGAIRKNILYVGGANGLTAIDPSLFSPPSSGRPLYIRAVRTETSSGLIDTSNLWMTSFDVPENALETTVYFSSINYPDPERADFSYRIKELNTNWIRVGKQDFINLIGMSPGKYSLQIKLTNEQDDEKHLPPLEIRLIFEPKWYQTIWFRLLVIAVISGMLYALYRYRIDQFHKQQQIRRNIASDLHDDIGSILNTVKIFTHLARKEQHKEDHLFHIEESLSAASMGLRDMIWVLANSEDTIRELLDRVKKFAIPVANAHGIRFECITEDGLANHTISKSEKRNLLLITKEAINNSIKYAGGSYIRVMIKLSGDRLNLSVQDDGKGFDVNDPNRGNGLRNMQERARQIRYNCTIRSSADSGTFVEVRKM